MKILAILILLLLIPVVSLVAQGSGIDIFPLTKNIHYSYSYFSESYISEFNNIISLFQDSGKVDYIVHDSSSINDTIVVWNIEQQEQILRHRYMSGVYDSLYWISDTMFFPLTENMNGSHEITTSSRVWSFPTSYPFARIYRFANSSPILLANMFSWPNPTGSTYDSLWFSNEMGFYRRYRYSSGGGIQYSSSTSDIRLIEEPIVQVHSTHMLILEYSLEQNFPNPFNPTTIIEYSIPREELIDLCLYDCLGRKIRVLEKGVQQAGHHSVVLHADDLATGIYFYRLIAGAYSLTKKLILMR
jgi:hypothetical protein